MDVTEVDAGDFTLATTGGAGGTIGAVTPITEDAYRIDIDAITGAGTLGLNLVDDNSITDLLDPTFLLGGPQIGDGDFTGEIYTVVDSVLRYTAPADSNPDDLTLRLNGTTGELEIFDNNAASVVAARLLADTHSVVITGAAGEDDRLTVDYSFSPGGFFHVPGGIAFDGGIGGSDHLMIHGTGATLAEYHSQGGPLGDAEVRTSEGPLSNLISFTGVEPLSISGMALLEVDGVLDVGGETLTLDLPAFANLGSPTTLDGGTVAAPGGVALSVGDNLTGHGNVDARIAAAFGSTIYATGDLSLGEDGSFAGFFSDGELSINDNAVTLHDLDKALLGSLTNIGDSGQDGVLTADNGILLEEGKTLVGQGDVHTAAGEFKNQGFLQGDGTGLTFHDPVVGEGDYGGTVTFLGNMSPGNSPAEIDASGNVTFGPQNVLTIEIGGLLAGEQFDQINVTGQVTLGGELHIEAIDLGNGYEFQPGDTFEVLTFGSAAGAFADITGLDLDDGLRLEPSVQENVLALTVVAKVPARHLFYNDSAYDALNEADAIAADKSPLIPGEPATLANYSSYHHGINGLIVDLLNPTATPTVGDFAFRVGNVDDTASWQPAPPTASFDVDPTGGEFGSTRVTITWANGAIAGQWLETTTAASLTGTAANVFYYGSAIGEVGNSETDTLVNAADIIAIRDNPRGSANPASIDDPHDINRDQRVDALDLILARNNATSPLSALRLIALAEAAAPAPMGEGESTFATGSSGGNDTLSLQLLDTLMAAETDHAVDDAPVTSATLSKLLRRLSSTDN